MAVDDDAAVLAQLESTLRAGGVGFRACSSAGAAKDLLQTWSPDLLLLDVALPDGSAFDVLDAVDQCRPTPLVVAISGAATTEQAFRLAQRGVRGYLHKPFGLSDLRRAVQRAAAQPPNLGPHLRNTVGQRPIQDVELEVRATMLDEALARTGGNRRGAARLLQVSRQLVQHMIRHLLPRPRS